MTISSIADLQKTLAEIEEEARAIRLQPDLEIEAILTPRLRNVALRRNGRLVHVTAGATFDEAVDCMRRFLASAREAAG